VRTDFWKASGEGVGGLFRKKKHMRVPETVNPKQRKGGPVLGYQRTFLKKYFNESGEKKRYGLGGGAIK